MVPRGWEGWRMIILWVGLMLPIVGMFIAFATTEPEGAWLYTGLALFVIAMTGWGIGGTVWMRRHSEIVDIEELLALKRERDAQKRRR
jgi:hypothetical protein